MTVMSKAALEMLSIVNTGHKWDKFNIQTL